jgi:hypothetical protein
VTQPNVTRYRVHYSDNQSHKYALYAMYRYAKCHYTDYHYAEYHYAEYRCAVYNYAECPYTEFSSTANMCINYAKNSQVWA